jgi:hypothetical protein
VEGLGLSVLISPGPEARKVIRPASEELKKDRGGAYRIHNIVQDEAAKEIR